MPRPSGTARRIRCEKHNLSYNPSTTPTCVLCAAEESSGPRPRDGLRVSPLTALGIIALAGGLVLGVARAGKALAHRGEQVYSEATKTAGKLDPESYRGLLEAVEAQVYPSQPPGFSHGSRIFEAAVELSHAIRDKVENNPFVDARLVDHSMDILSYGQRMSASEGIGYAAFDLNTAQSEWQEVRERVFLPTDWFTTVDVTPTIIAPASTLPVQPATDPAAIRALNDMALEMENLIRFARSTALPIGEPQSARDDWERRRMEEQWQNFRTAIGGRLRSAVNAVPEGRYRLSSDALRVRQYLANGITAIGSLVQSTSIPTRERRQRYIDQAERYHGQATLVLQELK